jgi:hypothetical protein
MHDATELIHAIAWPLTTLIIFLILRTELQRFTKNVADRIQSANTITIGLKGFELKGVVKVAPLPADLQARKAAFIRFIRNITNKRLLDNIADALSVPISTDIRAQRNDIILDINSRVETKREMDQLSAALKTITGSDF